MRLSVTFIPPEKGTYTVGIYNNGAGPYFYVDDVQLERGEAPSNVNLVENGDLQYWGVDWTEGPASKYYKGVGLFEEGEYAHSIRIIGDAYTESCGYQEIPIYQTGQSSLH